MVVCKCRKATKLYCFVHKVPVCGECIYFPEHQLCVVRTYSEWVIDGDYDWPSKCSFCQQALQDAEAENTIRLGCLHLLHVDCLEKHLRSFPAHTAPAGYVCPSCSTPVWPPKHLRDVGTGLPSRLKEIVSQITPSVVASNDSIPSPQPATAPPAFSSAPLAYTANNSSDKDAEALNAHNVSRGDTDGFADASSLLGSRGHGSGSAVTEIEAANAPGSGLPNVGLSTSPHFQKPSTVAPPLPGALTRKSSYPRGERSSSIVQEDYEDDDDGSRRKYTRRGSIYRQVRKLLLPFWSSSLPILPVTAPRKEDREPVTDEITESRPRRRPHRSSSVDPRKILLFFAIMSCMATMMLLYYRLAQGSSNSVEQEEP